MPYTKKEDRDKCLKNGVAELLNSIPKLTKGDINYIFNQIAIAYVLYKGKNYDNVNDTVGIFECAKLEFYRKFVAPYEDIKAEKNGDIFNV